MEYRNALPGEREDFLDLARLAFGFDLEGLIPKVYDVDQDPSAYHKVAVDDRGRIRSQVAVLPQDLVVAGRPLRLGFLGLVSTHPRDRGQGHMKNLMDLWLAEGRQRFDLMALYGQRQRYEHYGFTQGGIRLRHLVDIANVRHTLADTDAAAVGFRPLSEVADAGRFVSRLNQERLASVVRPPAEILKILGGFGQKAWGILERDRLIGYLTTNSEADEITEIGLADPGDLGRVVKAFLVFFRRPSVSVLTPAYDLALNQGLFGFAEATTLESADMYHIVDFARVLQAYLSLKWMTSGLSPGVFSAVLADQPVTATVDASGVSVTQMALPGALHLDRSAAQTLLLSNQGRFFRAAAPEGWFPLPLFSYYADRF